MDSPGPTGSDQPAPARTLTGPGRGPGPDDTILVPCSPWRPGRGDPVLLSRPTPAGRLLIGYRDLDRLLAVHGAAQPWFAARESRLRAVLRGRADVDLVVDPAAGADA